jgi:DNA repair protein RadC
MRGGVKMLMPVKYDEKHAESFMKGLKSLTGIPIKKIDKYAEENNLFNILDHPNIIEPNPQQFEKISLLNEFISTYRLLKMQEEQYKITLSSSARAGEYFASILSGIKDREKFMAAFMDTGNNIIETRIVSEGCLGEAVVYPRNVLKAALDCDCKSIILAHNHPGGSLSASPQDCDVTARLVSIFKPLEINVLDHVIVAGTKYFSMCEHGQMPGYDASKVNYQPISLGKDDVTNEITAEFGEDAGCEVDEEWEM